MEHKILLVEDNEMNRDMLSRYLVLFEYEVVEASNGLAALDKARSESPDLILMDMSLPKKSGWEATCLLKSADGTRSIPIIGLTAHAMVGDRERALLAGCDDYLTKPIDFTLLMDKLKQLLHSPAAGSTAEVEASK